MNKFKNTIDKIELSSTEKAKMLDNILSHKKKSFNFSTFALRFATFFIAFSIVTYSSYALVKYFKLDDKIKNLFDLNDKVADEIKGTDLNISKEYDDVTINIIQTINSNNNLYIRLDLIGKKNKKYISNNIFSKEPIKDEDINKYEFDDTIEYDYNSDLYEGIGLTLLDENNNTTSYLLEVSFTKTFETGNYYLKIYTSDDKEYDISFKVDKNETENIEKGTNKVIYNKNNLVLTMKHISINNNNVTVNYDVNNNELFNNLEEYGEQFDSCMVKYKDNSTEYLTLIVNDDLVSDNNYNSIFEYKGKFVDLDNVKSIIINNIEFEL